ncbi:MAG: hypothetical protein ACUVT7_01255 [Thermoplasmata archaeon]
MRVVPLRSGLVALFLILLMSSDSVNPHQMCYLPGEIPTRTVRVADDANHVWDR